VIWQPTELLIIVGAGVGAIVLGNPRHVLTEMWHQVRKVALRKKPDEEFQRQLLLLMYELLQTAAGGLKALDAHVEAPQESELFKRYPLILEEKKLLNFIVDNFRLMAMGKINAHELEGVLDQEIDSIHEEMTQPAKSLGKIGEAMPGFGILAAVLGIVMTMSVVAQGAGPARSPSAWAPRWWAPSSASSCATACWTHQQHDEAAGQRRAAGAGDRQGGAGHPCGGQAAAAGHRRRPPPGAAQPQAQLRPPGRLDRQAAEPGRGAGGGQRG
jgi:hypothetical protein